MARFLLVVGAACAWTVVPVRAAPAPSVSAPVVTAPTPRAVADFAALPFLSDPELSPDGKRYAAKLAVDGTQMLAIADIFDTGTKPRLIALGDNELNSWSWVNDDWLVIQIGAADKLDGDPFYVTRAAGVSSDGKTVKPIAFKEAGQYARVIWQARDGSPRILMTIQKSIYLDDGFWPEVDEVDVSTGRVRRQVDGQQGVLRWAADAAGTVRMGIGYNDSNRTSKLLYRDDASAKFHVIDRADGRRDEALTLPSLFTADAAKALTISDKDGADALYELDLKTLAIGKRIFGADGYDIDGLIADRAGTGVAGIALTTDKARVTWLDPTLAEVQAQLDKAVGARSARIVSLNADRTKLIVHVGSASEPGSFYYYDTKFGTMSRFAYANPAMKTVKLGPVSTIRYKARDGLVIPAVLTVPPGRDLKNLPLILFPHGGPEARDSEDYDWIAQFLADRGYAVIQPNYRGSTGYGTAFLDAGKGEWGLKMQDDLNDAVGYLASQGTIDPKRVCIMGASYGGYAALRGAQRDGAQFRCAISFAGVADLMKMRRYDGGFLNGNSAKAGWRESAPDLRAVSPVNYPQDFSTPLLLMHGKKDLRVPVDQSRDMARRLQAAGKDVRYVEQPLGDHHFTRQADRLQFLNEVEAFLKAHNPA